MTNCRATICHIPKRNHSFYNLCNVVNSDLNQYRIPQPGLYLFSLQNTGGWEAYRHHNTLTYTLWEYPKRLEPLIEEGLIDDVICQLMSGKEAMINMVRSGNVIRCAKVYKESNKRNFQQRSPYMEGRKVKNSRRARAIEKRWSLWPSCTWRSMAKYWSWYVMSLGNSRYTSAKVL